MTVDAIDRVEPEAPRLRVRPTEPASDPRWATFVQTHPRGLAFHHPAWLQTLDDTFGYRAVHLACEDEAGTLHGVFPLLYRRGQLRGRQLWSLPCTAVAGPLTTSAAATVALVRAALELAEDLRVDGLRIHSMSPDVDHGTGALSRIEGYPTFVIELPDRSAQLRFGPSAKHAVIKRGVKKAQEHGLLVREGERHEDLRAWYRLYLSTMREKAAPPLPFRLFDAAWNYLRPAGMLQLLLVERHAGRDTELVGGEVFLSTSQTVLGEFIGRRSDAGRLHSQDLIQWHAIHAAWEAGFRHFDLGDANPDDGLGRYKRKWGGQPRPMYRYVYPPVTDTQAPSGAISSAGRLRRLARPAWRYLPHGVAERAGYIFYHRV